MARFEQKTCLITDAAAQSGTAAALRLAEEGARLVLCCPGDARPAKEFLRQLDSAQVLYRVEPVDFCDEDGLSAMAGRLRDDKRFGGIDVMFYNIVPHPIRQHIMGMHLTQIDGMIDTVLTQAFLAVKVIGEAIAAQGGGSMVFLATLHDDKPTGFDPLSSMYMGALKNMSREASLFFGANNVRCNLIELGAAGGEDALYRGGLSMFYEGYPYKIPSGYIGDWGDLAALAAFLLSDECHYINGAEVRTDGGLLMHYIDPFANQHALRKAGKDVPDAYV